jgi:homopolymeric O-antigen transport system ATP-binding protein
VGDRNWQIAIFGTFDVENYGDLLFPLIAEAELTERLGSVTLHRFSYHARTPPDWPYAVTSVLDLPEIAANLDGVLIGGGFVIRFDKDVAPDYGPPTPAIHHPTGYWLTPALIALQHGVPLIWNAPGMHCNDIPSWADPLMKLALENSRYIAVRDHPSQATLARFVDKARISVLPDTGFGVARLIDEQRPSDDLSRLRELSGLSGPYIVVQATRGLDPFLAFVRSNSQLLRGFRFLVLPIGPVLGDDESIVGDALPGTTHLPVWPPPLLLAELISQAAAVVGHSYHLAITALAFGVPVFNSADLSVGKYTSLSGFEAVFPLPKDTERDLHLFMTRLGKTRPSPTVSAALGRLTRHWDQIAAIVREGPTAAQPVLDRFLQSLPTLLETASGKGDAGCVEKQRRIDELSKLLTEARVEIVARDDRITALYDSPSWRVTATPRFLMRMLKRLLGNRSER